MQSLYRAGLGLLGIAAAFATTASPVSAAAQFTTLYSFCPDAPTCAAGGTPNGVFAAANGDIYGTAHNNNAQPTATGFIFKMTRTANLQYTYSQVFSFPGCANRPACPSGIEPSFLVVGKSGALYGIAQGGTGGAQGGILFKITPEGQEQVLYNFCSQQNCADGSQPSSLTYFGQSGGKDWDEVSPLYGVTTFGGTGGFGLGGTVFKYNPGTTTLSTIYNFCTTAQATCHDGWQPGGNIAMTKNILYGTDSGNNRACGILWELNLTRHNRAKPLHAFGKGCNGVGDGRSPSGILLSRDPVTGDNVLAGLASQGGANGEGTEWSYDLDSKTYAQLINFCDTDGCPLGYAPGSILVKDTKGNWYGLNTRGDSTSNPNGHGELFETDQGGHGTPLHDFAAGEFFTGQITRWKNQVFGVTLTGGTTGNGSVYVVVPGK